jgi:hypothetical protein
MDRALLGYRQEHPPLFGGEITLKLDFNVDLIDQAAVSGALGVHLLM